MILEFLFFDKRQREQVEQFNREQSSAVSEDTQTPLLEISYKDFDGCECWIVRYEKKGNSEKDAKESSEIVMRICQTFSPVIVTDESSEYFNKSLYPLVNKFERLLRKFLYLKVSQCDENRFRNIVTDIDKKDFGDIYTMLFVDSNFRTEARDKIKKLNTRAEMFEAIDSLQESTAWHVLVGDAVLSIIKDNFDLLKEYRNDVMHAHNISWDKYKKAKKLFSDANTALQNEISQLLQYPSAILLSEKTVSTLYDKLMAFNENAEKIGKGLSAVVDMFAKLASPSYQVEVPPNLEKALLLLRELVLDAPNDETTTKTAADEEK